MKTVFICIVFCLGLTSTMASAEYQNSLEIVLAQANEFRKTLSKNHPEIVVGTALVPKDWSEADRGETTELIPIFWWKRPGRDPSFPPLAYIHGGPASNSSSMITAGASLLKDYPGDVVTFDHRGEGASKTQPSNLHPDLYAFYRGRSIVRDLEHLRFHVFGYPQWRILGHSRGAAIAHYYLETHPDGIESAHVMGFSLANHRQQSQYTLTRAQGFAQVAQAYLKKYPGDDQRVKHIRQMIPQDLCWDSLDGNKICGPAALDVLSGHLRYVTQWSVLHANLQKMVDLPTVTRLIGEQIQKTPYGHTNYILGTNGRDLGSPSVELGLVLMRTQDPLYTSPFLSELRYFTEGILHGQTINWQNDADVVDYNRVRGNLLARPHLRYFLYAGEFDPIAPPKSYRYERSQLGGMRQFQFSLLPGVGHEAFLHPKVIEKLLIKEYPRQSCWSLLRGWLSF